MAKITFYIPDQHPAKYDLSNEVEIVIGRAADCDIILDHSSVSGRHATIRQIGAGLHVLIDNHSTNGIFLEGEKVTEAPLANGASFTIGQVPADYEGDEVAHTHASSPAASVDASSLLGASGGGYGSPVAHLPEVSTRPAGFKTLSPVPKIVKKDTLGKVALILGAVAIVTALALILMSLTVMSVG